MSTYNATTNFPQPPEHTPSHSETFRALAVDHLGEETKQEKIKTQKDLTKQNSLEYEQMYAAIESAKTKGPVDYHTSIKHRDGNLYNFKISADQETNAYKDENGQDCAGFTVTTTLERINGLSLPNYKRTGGVISSEIEVGPKLNRLKLCTFPDDN